VINHKDENPTNNCVENLEWCTQLYNATYSTGTPIKCLDLETNEINYYPSIHAAGRKLNIKQQVIWDSIYKHKKPYKNKYYFTEIEKEKD